jgi:hypothetical protein
MSTSDVNLLSMLVRYEPKGLPRVPLYFTSHWLPILYLTNCSECAIDGGSKAVFCIYSRRGLLGFNCQLRRREQQGCFRGNRGFSSGKIHLLGDVFISLNGPKRKLKPSNFALFLLFFRPLFIMQTEKGAKQFIWEFLQCLRRDLRHLAGWRIIALIE